MSTEEKNIYLIDGNSLCYRAFYAIQELSNSKGMPTNAIYGFINILKKIIKQYEPDSMIVTFDTKAPTVRHKRYEEYKIHRKPMPDDLITQMPRIKEVVDAYNIPMFELEGYEADDIIATIAEKAVKKGINVTIVTGDKDALQLVSDNVRVLSSTSFGDKIYSEKEVVDKFGVKPDSMVELMALMGDSSDNVPGVKGIGKVTASKLVNEYGSIENIYKNIDSISSESLKGKLESDKEMALLSKELVILDRKVPVKVDLSEAVLTEPDNDRLIELFKEFEFSRLLKGLTPAAEVEVDSSRVETEKDLDKVLKNIKKNKAFSFFTRVGDGGEAEGIAISYDEKKAFYVSLGDKKIFKEIKDLFEDSTILKIGYDVKSDIKALGSKGINVAEKYFDIMIGAYLLDPSRTSYDFADISMHVLGLSVPSDKGQMAWDDKGQAELTLEAPVSVEYECQRSNVLMQLFDKVYPDIKKKELLKLFEEVEMPLVRVLADMENTGVGIDVEYMQKMSEKMAEELSALTDTIYEEAGESFNVNSPKQLQTILFEKLGLPVQKKTKTGASTDESVLSRLTAYHELPKLLLEYREMNKLKTAYYDSILNLVDKKSKLLHAKFNQAVTATGRLSSSGPNLQNIPIKTERGKAIRRAFVPVDKKMVILAADYSQIELRILAHMSEDKNLLKAFKNGEDIHKFTASLIFDCDPDLVTKTMRNMAKTVNFGIIYGISAFRLAKELDITVAEAQKFIDAYFKRYKGVTKFIDDTVNEVREKGYVTTLLNRRRYVPDITSKVERVRSFAERVAVNTPVQGSAADIIKLAMIPIQEKLKGSPVKMMIQVHDELVFSVPEDMLKETAMMVKELMEGVIELKVPLEVDLEYGPNWKDLELVKI